MPSTEPFSTVGFVRLRLQPRTVLAVQAGLVALLIAATLAGQYAKLVLGHDFVFGLVSLFDVDGERNIPTWFQASTLLGCSVLLGAVAAGTRAGGRRFVGHWVGLAVIFLYISADEAAFIHELTNPVLQRWQLPPALHYSWVVFGAVFVAVFLAVYAPFVIALPPRTRALFVAAGAVFVGGALGVEMLGGWMAATDRAGTFLYAVEAAVEEGMEMIGVAIFTYALLDYIQRAFGGISIGIDPDTAAGPS